MEVEADVPEARHPSVEAQPAHDEPGRRQDEQRDENDARWRRDVAADGSDDSVADDDGPVVDHLARRGDDPRTDPESMQLLAMN